MREYADAHLRAGDVPAEQALPRAQKDYDELLPNGLRSDNQFLFTLTHEALGAIGILWFELRALELLDVELDELGVHSIGLNVFGYNHAARALYEKMGYQITRIAMIKRLAPPAT